jgi:hypothetical protein
MRSAVSIHPFGSDRYNRRSIGDSLFGYRENAGVPDDDDATGPSTPSSRNRRADWLHSAAEAEGVPAALVAARDSVDALFAHRGTRRMTLDVAKESLLLGAVASANLEGSTSTADDLQQGRADPVAGAVAAMYAEVLALVPALTRSPLQAIARIHAIAAAATESAEQRGRLRSEPGLASRMQALASDLLRSGLAPRGPAQQPAPPAIAVAGLAHATIAATRPFLTMNGVVGRAVERLVLVARGVDPASVLVPEAGHRVLVNEYRRCVERLRLADEEQDDAALAAARRAYLLYTARAVAYAVEASPLRR